MLHLHKTAQLLFLILLSAMMISCERHPPLTQSQAEALANAKIASSGNDWGRAESIKLSDRIGDRRFWVLRYEPSEEGYLRMVAVNYRSGWIRILTPDDELTEVIHINSRTPVVLLLDEVTRDEWGDETLQAWQERSQTLNSEAREAGREPLYSIRQTYHSWQLVWGWNEGRGTNPGPQERRQLHGLHAAAIWIELE